MDFASQNLTAGQLNAIVKKLGGEDGAMQFLRGELVVSSPTLPDFPVWKTIRLGTGLRTALDFSSAIKRSGMTIGYWGNDILLKSSFVVLASEWEREVDLVNISVSDLGFKHEAYRWDIIAKAVVLGLVLCSPEVGPQLRLQYPDQPKGEWLLIGMDPITGSDGFPYIFFVGCDNNEPYLGGYSGSPEDLWGIDSRFVFVRPRK